MTPSGNALRLKETLVQVFMLARRTVSNYCTVHSQLALSKPPSTQVGAEMQEERARATTLQSAQANLEVELRETKNQELLHRRGLLAAADELADTKKLYERKVQELENEKRQIERKWKEAVDDYRLVQNDLKMERENGAALKVALAQQSNTQLTLQAHLDASQRLARSLQEEVEKRLGSASEMQIQLEKTMKRNEFLEAEAVINEQLRRKLHNQIQELKGWSGRVLGNKWLTPFTRQHSCLCAGTPSGQRREGRNEWSSSHHFP